MKVKIYQYSYITLNGTRIDKNDTSRPKLIDEFYDCLKTVYEDIQRNDNTTRDELPDKSWLEKLPSTGEDNWIINNDNIKLKIMIDELDVKIPSHGYALINPAYPVIVPRGCYFDDMLTNTCGITIYTNPNEFIDYLNHIIREKQQQCIDSCKECNCKRKCTCKPCKCTCDIEFSDISSLEQDISDCKCGYYDEDKSFQHLCYPEGTEFTVDNLDKISEFSFRDDNHNIISIGINSTDRVYEDLSWIAKIKIA